MKRGTRIKKQLGGDAKVRSRRGCQRQHRGSETVEQDKDLLLWKIEKQGPRRVETP